MAESCDSYKIGVPVGTRLQGLQRLHWQGKNGWALWTGLANPKHNPSQWYGTFLFCADDGSVTHVQVHELGNEEYFLVKGPDK